MDVRKPIQTVVQGEASESDDDETTQQIHPQLPSTASRAMPVSAIVVSGEAPESEDEEEIDTSKHLVIPPLQVNTADVGDRGDITNTDPGSPTPVPVTELVKPRYNSLLHRKLRERNQALRRHIVDNVQQTYTSCGRDLHNITLQLQKTQIAIQDVSHHMRLTTNDLFHLEDKVDIVRTCNILPDINIAVPTANATGIRPST